MAPEVACREDEAAALTALARDLYWTLDIMTTIAAEATKCRKLCLQQFKNKMICEL
jgi:hypothetical protein